MRGEGDKTFPGSATLLKAGTLEEQVWEQSENEEHEANKQRAGFMAVDVPKTWLKSFCRE